MHSGHRASFRCATNAENEDLLVSRQSYSNSMIFSLAESQPESDYDKPVTSKLRNAELLDRRLLDARSRRNQTSSAERQDNHRHKRSRCVRCLKHFLKESCPTRKRIRK